MYNTRNSIREKVNKYHSQNLNKFKRDYHASGSNSLSQKNGCITVEIFTSDLQNTISVFWPYLSELDWNWSNPIITTTENFAEVLRETFVILVTYRYINKFMIFSKKFLGKYL